MKIPFVTLSVETQQPRFITRIMESVPAPTTHVVGVGSGLTGVALWAEWAKHLTVLMGLAVAFLAVLGGAFYAAYWALKVVQKWRELGMAKAVVKVRDEEG